MLIFIVDHFESPNQYVIFGVDARKQKCLLQISRLISAINVII